MTCSLRSLGNILQPSARVAGHCIAVDPWFIVSRAPEEVQLIRAAREINDRKPEWVLDNVAAAVDAKSRESDKAPTNRCIGLTFKPNIDNLRESPALAIAERLSSSYPRHVLVVELNMELLPWTLVDKVLKCNLTDRISAGDILVVLVDHDYFRNAPAASLWLIRTASIHAESGRPRGTSNR